MLELPGFVSQLTVASAAKSVVTEGTVSHVSAHYSAYVRSASCVVAVAHQGVACQGNADCTIAHRDLGLCLETRVVVVANVPYDFNH